MVAPVGDVEFDATLQTFWPVAPFRHPYKWIQQAGQQLSGGHHVIEQTDPMIIAYAQRGAFFHQ